jgi:hypothetical protein
VCVCGVCVCVCVCGTGRNQTHQLVKKNFDIYQDARYVRENLITFVEDCR